MVEPNSTNIGQTDNKSTVISGNGAVGGVGVGSDLKIKKVKTLRQIERERARRKRRRAKKAQLAHPNESDVQTVNVDKKPLVESEIDYSNKQTTDELIVQENELLASMGEDSVVDENQVVDKPVIPNIVENQTSELLEELPVSEVESKYDESVVVENAINVPEEVKEELVSIAPDSAQAKSKLLISEIEPKIEEEVVQDFLSGPEFAPVENENVENEVIQEEVILEPAVPPQDWIEPKEVPEVVHEEYLEEVNTLKAKEIAQNLLGEETHHLEELVVKQGMFGKLFDWISSFSKNKQKIKDAHVSVVEKVKDKSAQSKFDFEKLWPILKNLLGIMVLIILIIGVFWLGSSLKLYDRVMGLFATQPGQIQLAKGDNAKVIYDEALLAKLGFKSGRIFARNGGNVADLGFDIFFNANYFGKLKEPIFYGETGISAAIYYGFEKDIDYVKNRFVFYVTFLQKINNANTVNINNVLSGKLRRDEVLNKYLLENRLLFNEGNLLRKEINVQVDDLKISANSVTPDKEKFQVDFFASLANLNGEKANVELLKFIDVSQKLVEIKAKLAAMTTLSENYESLLVVLKDRLDIIEKNQQALINGVPVAELP